MKTPLLFLLTCCTFFGSIPSINRQTHTSNSLHPLQTAITPSLPADSLAPFRELLPLALLHPKSKNMADKYGIEFQGNCYDCDLAALALSKTRFEWVNVCNKLDRWSAGSFTYSSTASGLFIKTAHNEFRFTKAENIPVYELTITGDKLTLKNKRFSRYYTTKKQLATFRQHDCGEFGG